MLRMCVQANHYLRETGRNAYNSAVKNVRVGIVRQVPCVRDVDHGRKNLKERILRCNIASAASSTR